MSHIGEVYSIEPCRTENSSTFARRGLAYFIISRRRSKRLEGAGGEIAAETGECVGDGSGRDPVGTEAAGGDGVGAAGDKRLWVDSA